MSSGKRDVQDSSIDMVLKDSKNQFPETLHIGMLLPLTTPCKSVCICPPEMMGQFFFTLVVSR
jgi:hypothetical protein